MTDQNQPMPDPDGHVEFDLKQIAGVTDAQTVGAATQWMTTIMIHPKATAEDRIKAMWEFAGWAFALGVARETGRTIDQIDPHDPTIPFRIENKYPTPTQADMNHPEFIGDIIDPNQKD